MVKCFGFGLGPVAHTIKCHLKLATESLPGTWTPIADKPRQPKEAKLRRRHLRSTRSPTHRHEDALRSRAETSDRAGRSTRLAGPAKPGPGKAASAAASKRWRTQEYARRVQFTR